MPSNTRAISNGLRFAAAAGLFAGLAGCAHAPNQFREDGPFTVMPANSVTGDDIYARYQPAAVHTRDWPQTSATAQSGAVTHSPLYFEDPFEDKGHGREGTNKYHLGWEDYVALAYGYPRFTLNWIGLPVSAVVQPPWMTMESDGEISQQALGPDHDATPLGSDSSSAAVAQPEAYRHTESGSGVAEPGQRSAPSPAPSPAPPRQPAAPAPQPAPGSGAMQIRSVGGAI